MPLMACLTRVALSVLAVSALCAAHSLSYTQAQPVSISRLYLLLVVLVSRKPGCCYRGAVTGLLGEPKLPVLSPPTKVNLKNHRRPCPMSTSLRVFQGRLRGCGLLPLRQGDSSFPEML